MIRSSLVVLAISTLFFVIINRKRTVLMNSNRPEWKYTAQHGFFSHDSDPESWDFRATTRPDLGLLERSYPTDATVEPKHQGLQWRRFEHYIRSLNQENPAQRRYKMFYIIRHGEGTHNVKEKEVGREEWDRHWSKLSGDGTTVWEDAALTPLGEQQARDISTFFGTSNIPFPELLYTSPLRRCLRTTELAFAPILSTKPPIIKEKLRERLGIHTCDKRSTKSFITSTYPTFTIEPGFTEDDELWNTDTRETFEEHVERSKELLDEIFEDNETLFVSLTAHSGAIMALFSTAEWKKIPVAASSVYPLLILAEKLD